MLQPQDLGYHETCVFDVSLTKYNLRTFLVLAAQDLT